MCVSVDPPVVCVCFNLFCCGHYLVIAPRSRSNVACIAYQIGMHALPAK